MNKMIPALIWVILSQVTAAQDPAPVPEKTVQALRIEKAVKVDGLLNEPAWQQPGTSGFVQLDPLEGQVPTEKTEVWVAYSDTHLYVAARLHDSLPDGILGLLGRRDSEVDSDWFFFAVDPYFDRRSGYQFAVNPAGTILDMTLSNDVSQDNSWDGIWEARVRTDNKGWAVEMAIPFNQLRFPRRDEYVWGVNFRRVIKRKNENDALVLVRKDERAYVSRFARLEGIRSIRPGRHLEAIPYSVGQAQFKPEEAGNPFETGQNFLVNMGLDLKMGLKSNLTLDATFNPDFGQVEVDPAVINLSAYETFYEEKRPFFIEGSSIFQTFGRGGLYMNLNIAWPQPTFFYSRRIGRPPQGEADTEGYSAIPDRTTILGAIKLTGRLGSWNLGLINALTAREYAEIDELGIPSKQEVEPFSYYGVMRLQKEMGDGRQGLGLMLTHVNRDLDNFDLDSLLNRRAFALGVDGWSFLNESRSWVVGGWLGGTMVQGSPSQIESLQMSSMHYFQRPDASHVEVDPHATSLTGWGGRLVLSKQQGSFLLMAALGVLSPGFDLNDLGFQYGSSDRINSHLMLLRQWTKPGKIFRNVMVFAGPFANYDFGGNRTWAGVLLAAEGEFANFWGFNTLVAYNPDTFSNDQTRGGPLVLIPAGYQIDLGFYSDSRRKVVLSAYLSTYRRPTEGRSLYSEIGLRWKPKSNLSLSVAPQYSEEVSELQWIDRFADPLMVETYGARYVFGRIRQRVLSSELRLDWIFNPQLSLQLYLQPFLAVGTYTRFKELARPKTYEYSLFGEKDSTILFDDGVYTIDPDGSGPAQAFSFDNPDFNYKSLRGTVVLRWEYRPGSILYLVWTQNRTDTGHPGDLRLGRDLHDLFSAQGDNIFLVKFTYRFNL